MKPPIPLRNQEEYDAFTGWRKVLRWSRGELARIKRAFNRRARRFSRRQLADVLDDDVATETGLARCRACEDIATWVYMPDEQHGPFCDAHVPRGCSCVDEPNEPCCEWNECEEGVSLS
jgi:hypothetical protein